MFVSTGPDIHSVARSCLHEPGGHVVGVRLPDGSFLSRTTAEYPPQLARALATIIRPFVTSGAEVLQVAECCGSHWGSGWFAQFRAQRGTFGLGSPGRLCVCTWCHSSAQSCTPSRSWEVGTGAGAWTLSQTCCWQFYQQCYSQYCAP